MEGELSEEVDLQQREGFSSSSFLRGVFWEYWQIKDS